MNFAGDRKERMKARRQSMKKLQRCRSRKAGGRFPAALIHEGEAGLTE
jgi:hypothetical protein